MTDRLFWLLATAFLLVCCLPSLLTVVRGTAPTYLIALSWAILVAAGVVCFGNLYNAWRNAPMGTPPWRKISEVEKQSPGG
jgi:hypothetical protein